MAATTISDISDLVRILKEQPEWAEVIRGILLNEEVVNQIVGSLTQAVESLGQTVGLLSQTVDLLSRRIDSMAGELSQMREDYNRLEGRVGRMEGHVEGLEVHVEGLKVHVGGLEVRVGGLEGRVGGLEGRVGGLEVRVGGLEVQVEELKGQVEQLIVQVQQLEARVGRLEGRVGNLEGSDYERKVRYRVRSRAGRSFGLVSPYLALTQNDPAAAQFDSAVQRAVNTAVISADESDELFETDIIISAQGNRHVAVEVSLTAADYDIIRAAARAEILGRVTGGEVMPAIVTADLDDRQRALADAQGVTVFVIEYP